MDGTHEDPGSLDIVMNDVHLMEQYIKEVVDTVELSSDGPVSADRKKEEKQHCHKSDPSASDEYASSPESAGTKETKRLIAALEAHADTWYIK